MIMSNELLSVFFRIDSQLTTDQFINRQRDFYTNQDTKCPSNIKRL